MSFLLLWSARALATIALGLLFVLALRKRSAATRNLVLRITLAVALALPLAALYAPRLPVSMPASRASSPSAVIAPIPVAEGWSVEEGTAFDAPKNRSLLPPRSPHSVQHPQYPAGPARPPDLRAWRRRAPPSMARGLRAPALARAGTAEDGYRRADIPVPATYGRTILLPFESSAWPEARVRAAVLHETAHLRRRDWHWQALATLFAALHWANPAAWLFLRLLRDTAEAAADDEALAAMGPSDYARELLAVAATAGRVGPAVAMARRGGVKDRIEAILASHDRRAPTRCAIALLLAALATAGVALAGLTFSRPRTIVLREATDATGRRWNATGRLVANGTPIPTGPVFGTLPPSERWVTLELGIDESPSPRDLTVEADSPVRINGCGPTDLAESPVRVWMVAPKGLLKTDFRVGFAEGPWQDVPGSAAFRRTVEKSAILGDGPRYVVSVDYPARYQHEQVRIVARKRDGTAPERIASGKGPRYATLQLKGRTTDLASVVLQHRPYAWTTLRDVPLGPKRVASEVDATRNLDKGRRVELVGVWSPDGTEKPWRPDGSASGLDWVGNYDGTIPIGMRTVLLAFRVRGSAIRVPTVQAHPAYPGAKFVGSSLSLLREEPESLLMWVRTIVPNDLEKTDIDVDLKLDRDDVGPPLPLGTKRGQTTVEVASVDVRPTASYAQLRVTPHVPMDPARFWYGVSPVDLRGESPEAFGYEEPGPTFRISMAHPERAVAWRVWKAPRTRVRFEGAHLRPNP